MKIRAIASELPRHRFPIDPWRLVETELCDDDRGRTETLFAIGNGYLGMRANPSEGREAFTHGTYINGFHETWKISHAEEAVGFAETGQTIVNVPDAKLMKLYVDDEPLLLADADVDSYERVLDFQTGRSHRELVWTTPSGKRVRVRTERMTSMTQRHLAVLTFELQMLDGTAPVVVSSQLLNRQDGEDEYHVTDAALGEGRDPRQNRKFDTRVLEPQLQRHDVIDSVPGGEVVLGYRCASSRMTLAAGYQHRLETSCDHHVETDIGPDLAKTVFTFTASPGDTIRITKFVAYHTSRGVPAEELADRCHRTLLRAGHEGCSRLQADQAAWMDDYWKRADVELEGDPAAQQAIRWNLFQVAQASAATNEQGVPAKGVTGGGYDGHYFWDSEVYVLPMLAYTYPEAARKLLRFRQQMLDAARSRAAQLSESGALYPWRTINGEEASAYYAAGTAQYHINAAVAFAVERYVEASGDREFLANEGAEILVETARMWADLGFFEANGTERFRIHSVTGPDEYTTVVNDNLYTNVMARFNLAFAAETVRLVADEMPHRYEALVRRTGLTTNEIDRWERCAAEMYLPFDERLGIHPQDESFLARERWPFEATPPEKYPLLLHFHPLVIYRYQVLKQADVVLAMYLQGRHFSREQKRRNFEYYDPLTTGDSSLSACVQSIVAAEVGKDDLALDYFKQSLYLDLADTHGNTADGVHIANAAGVWAAIVHGFAGMVDRGEHLSFEPRLPVAWEHVSFPLRRHGTSLRVTVRATGATVEVIGSGHVPVMVDGETLTASADAPVFVPPRSREDEPRATP